MKRIVVFTLILNAALLGVIAQQFIALAGDDGPLSTRQNGDVNGDQILDMSDAVYLLIHLFNGGPEPVALADSPEVLDRLDTLEATQGALQQGLTDLEADLPSLVSNTVFEATGLQWTGVYQYRPGRTRCPTTESIDSGWFEEPDFMQGGVLSDDGSKIRFRTERAGTLIIQGYGGGGGQIASIDIRSVGHDCDGGRNSVRLSYDAWATSGGLGTYVLIACAPGEYEIVPRGSVRIPTGGGFCSDFVARGDQELFVSGSIGWLRVGYLD